jgi:hypothetical protein
MNGNQLTGMIDVNCVNASTSNTVVITLNQMILLSYQALGIMARYGAGGGSGTLSSIEWAVVSTWSINAAMSGATSAFCN